MVTSMGDGMRIGLLTVTLMAVVVILAVVALTPVYRTGEDQDVSNSPTSREQQHDPLGPNAGCYVCHITFVGEELTVTHLDQQIGCVKCHGISDGHANDENIGATPPDVVLKHDQVNGFCQECHQNHDVPAEEVIARWLQRSKPQSTSQPLRQSITCTDCHGNHRLDQS